MIIIIYFKKKFESKKEEDDELFKDNDNSINLKDLLEEDKINNDDEKNILNSNKINLTSKHIINSMKKDFKTLTKKRLELNNLEISNDKKNGNLKSHSCNGTDTSKAGNTMENYYLFDFLRY